MEENKKIKYLGGSRIGSKNATFPFSTLGIEKNKLTLKTFLIGTLEFFPQDIHSIEEVFYFPLIAQGIKINHNNLNYKEKIIFWSFDNPKKIIKRIEEQEIIQIPNERANLSIHKGFNNSREKIRFSIPVIYIISFLGIILFGSFMIWKSFNRYSDHIIIEENFIGEIEIVKATVDHGSVIANDSIIIPNGTKLISKRPNWLREKNPPINARNREDFKPWFNDLNVPYNIYKNENSLELKVVKNNDTLIFELPDSDLKDPYDPTFKDVFQALFGSKQ